MKKILFRVVLCTLLALTLAFPAFAAEADSYIVRLESPLPDLLSLSEESVREISARHGLYLVSDPALLTALERDGLLLSATPDAVVELLTDTGAPTTGAPTTGAPTTGAPTTGEPTTGGEVVPEPAPQPDRWHLEMLDLTAANRLGCYGQGVTIALIDSGVSAHEELTDSLLPGHNYLTGSSDVTDNIGHGTFVAGLIGASDDGAGLIGAAPVADILPLKCFDRGKTTTVSTICTAIYDAVDVYGCDIINMSFGLTSNNPELEKAVNYAAEQGLLLTAAVGNNGSSRLYYPAAYDAVIGVGAVDSNGLHASFSHTNASVLVSAPGKALTSAATTGGWRTDSGTSYSTPLVTAVLARLLNADPTLNRDSAVALLSATATDLGDEGYDTSYGYGLVSLTAGLNSLLGDAPAFLAPMRVTNGQAALRLTNRSGQPLSVMAGLYDANGRFTGFYQSDEALAAGDTEVVLFALPQDGQAVQARAFLLEPTLSPRLPYLHQTLTLN